jgi:hypothetical protein
MQKNNILLYSFKEGCLLIAEDFFGKSGEFYFKIIDDDRFLVCEYDRKIIVEINEIFRFQNDIYSFIIDRFPVSIFLNKREENNYFCLLSFGKNGFKNIIFRYVFFIFFLKFIYKITVCNIKIILILVILVSLFHFILNKNIVHENLEGLKNNYLLQKKVNIGYQNILLLLKNSGEEKVNEGNLEMRQNKIIPVLKISKDKQIFFKNKVIKMLPSNKSIDKDMEYFLKMNKNMKKK